jgi:hypothetical protein
LLVEVLQVPENKKNKKMSGRRKDDGTFTEMSNTMTFEFINPFKNPLSQF